MKLLKISIAVFVWGVFWLTGQALFFTNFSILPPDLNRNIIFLVYTLWILLIGTIALFLWKWKFNDFHFLSIKNKKVLWLYLLPFIFAVIIALKGASVDINRFLFIIGIITTTFLAQDMLTFGFLQTYLGKVVKPVYAFVITSSVFFLGHLTYDASFYTLILLAGSFIFGFLRFKTKNIYLLDIIHMTVLLLPF